MFESLHWKNIVGNEHLKFGKIFNKFSDDGMDNNINNQKLALSHTDTSLFTVIR